MADPLQNENSMMPPADDNQQPMAENTETPAPAGEEAEAAGSVTFNLEPQAPAAAPEVAPAQAEMAPAQPGLPEAEVSEVAVETEATEMPEAPAPTDMEMPAVEDLEVTADETMAADERPSGQFSGRMWMIIAGVVGLALALIFAAVWFLGGTQLFQGALFVDNLTDEDLATALHLNFESEAAIPQSHRCDPTPYADELNREIHNSLCLIIDDDFGAVTNIKWGFDFKAAATIKANVNLVATSIDSEHKINLLEFSPEMAQYQRGNTWEVTSNAEGKFQAPTFQLRPGTDGIPNNTYIIHLGVKILEVNAENAPDPDPEPVELPIIGFQPASITIAEGETLDLSELIEIRGELDRAPALQVQIGSDADTAELGYPHDREGKDYINLFSGEQTATVSFNSDEGRFRESNFEIADDTLVEGNEEFTIEMLSVNEEVAELGANDTLRVTIEDNDENTILSFVLDNELNMFRGREQENGGTGVSVRFNLSQPLEEDLFLQFNLDQQRTSEFLEYSFEDARADDLIIQLDEENRGFTIPAGDTSGNFQVNIITDDRGADDIETVEYLVMDLIDPEVEGLVIPERTKFLVEVYDEADFDYFTDPNGANPYDPEDTLSACVLGDRMMAARAMNGMLFNMQATPDEFDYQEFDGYLQTLLADDAHFAENAITDANWPAELDFLGEVVNDERQSIGLDEIVTQLVASRILTGFDGNNDGVPDHDSLSYAPFDEGGGYNTTSAVALMILSTQLGETASSYPQGSCKAAGPALKLDVINRGRAAGGVPVNVIAALPNFKVNPPSLLDRFRNFNLNPLGDGAVASIFYLGNNIPLNQEVDIFNQRLTRADVNRLLEELVGRTIVRGLIAEINLSEDQGNPFVSLTADKQIISNENTDPVVLDFELGDLPLDDDQKADYLIEVRPNGGQEALFRLAQDSAPLDAAGDFVASENDLVIEFTGRPDNADSGEFLAEGTYEIHLIVRNDGDTFQDAVLVKVTANQVEAVEQGIAVTPAVLIEAPANNGTFGEPLRIELSGNAFKPEADLNPGMLKIESEVEGMQDLFDQTIELTDMQRESDTVLKIALKARADRHIDENDMTGLALVIDNAAFDADLPDGFDALTSNTFDIDFIDEEGEVSPALRAVNADNEDVIEETEENVGDLEMLMLMIENADFAEEVTVEQLSLNEEATLLGVEILSVTPSPNDPTGMLNVLMRSPENHAEENNLTGVTITIDPAAIDGSEEALESTPFAINFIDAEEEEGDATVDLTLGREGGFTADSLQPIALDFTAALALDPIPTNADALICVFDAELEDAELDDTTNAEFCLGTANEDEPDVVLPRTFALDAEGNYDSSADEEHDTDDVFRITGFADNATEGDALADGDYIVRLFVDNIIFGEEEADVHADELADDAEFTVDLEEDEEEEGEEEEGEEEGEEEEGEEEGEEEEGEEEGEEDENETIRPGNNPAAPIVLPGAAPVTQNGQGAFTTNVPRVTQTQSRTVRPSSPDAQASIVSSPGVQGQTGPGMLVYPFLAGGSYLLARRRRRKETK